MTDKELSPTTDNTRKRIMEAASRLFAEKGFAGTTTRAIAELAKVNEVTLFRHFGTKEGLAKAVMDQYGGQAIAKDLELAFSGDFVDDLTLIGRMMMQVMSERTDAIRMAICEASTFPEFREVVAENPRQLRQMLARYFDRQIEAGRIRDAHAEVLAQAFLGMFFSYSVLKGFLFDSLDPKVTAEEITAQFVDLFIHGTLIEEV